MRKVPHNCKDSFGLISYNTALVLFDAIQLWSYLMQYGFGLISYNISTALVLYHTICSFGLS